jgi:uncharacterized protein (DUF427 family)
MESVWDYPRPPAVVPCERRVRVELGGQTVVDSTRALRVLETASPPTIYVPRADVAVDLLVPVPGHSVCEWKGTAAYGDLVVGARRAERAAWWYPEPVPAYRALLDHLSFFPGRVDACYLDDEPVRAQEGGFYGGWITGDIRGPFKGGPGTQGW